MTPPTSPPIRVDTAPTTGRPDAEILWDDGDGLVLRTDHATLALGEYARDVFAALDLARCAQEEGRRGSPDVRVSRCAVPAAHRACSSYVVQLTPA